MPKIPGNSLKESDGHQATFVEWPGHFQVELLDSCPTKADDGYHVSIELHGAVVGNIEGENLSLFCRTQVLHVQLYIKCTGNLVHH